MPASAPAAADPAAAAPAAEVAAPKEKTVFNVTLTKIDATQKAKAIREVKAIMPSMNLVEVRYWVAIAYTRFRREDEVELTQALSPCVS